MPSSRRLPKESTRLKTYLETSLTLARYDSSPVGVHLDGFKGNTVELAVRYVRNRASNYSPLTKGGYRGVSGRGDPADLGRKITPPTPPSQGGDEFAISTATVGYS